MKSTYRKILSFLTILCFIIVAPTLIFYANGYRFDLKTKSIKKVGMLILESEPKEANVLINNKLVGNKTPYRAKNLLPGEYNIKIKKEGYSSWEKNLTVKSKEVSWASSIFLFLENPQKEILTSHAVSEFILSPSKDKIAYINTEKKDSGIWVNNLPTLINSKIRESQKIFPNEKNLTFEQFKNTSVSELQFSENAKELIFSIKKEGQKNYGIINLDSLETTFLSDLFKGEIKNVKWDNDETIFFQDKNNYLYKFNLTDKKIYLVLSENIINYEINKNKIFYFEKNNKNSKVLLKMIDKDNFQNSKPQILEKLKLTNNIIIKKSLKEYLSYLDLDNSILYLFSDNKQKIISQDKIKDFIWSDEDDKLLYFNENEIWFYAVSKSDKNIKLHPEYQLNTQNLLTRISNKINKAAFYGEEYAIFLQDDYLKIIEFDERDKRNIFELKTNANNSVYTFDRNGKNLYFIDEDTKNLVGMKIMEK